MTTVSRFIATLGLSAALGAALSAGALAQTQLKASHQWPGGKGDVRDEMVQIIAREVAAADVGLDIRIYPAASLFKPTQQWDAMVQGQLDISAFPLDYASGKHPQFSATLMPGLVKNHEHARRLNDSAVHGGHQADHRRAGRDGAVGRLARRRLRQQGRMRARAGERPGQGDARGRPGLRADAGGGRRLDQLDAELRDLHRAADRRARRRQHQLRQLRVVPHLRAGRLPDAARRRVPSGSCTSRS